MPEAPHGRRHRGPSQARCKRVARQIRADRRDDPARWEQLSPNARLVYVIGALTCNDAGVVKRDRLVTAMRDPELLRRAHELLAIDSIETAGRCG